MRADANTKHRRIFFALLAAWCVAAALFVFYGRYVGDEGFYCLISREVWRGRELYSDVRFTQMPLLPYLYGGVLGLLPARIESGRGISLLLTLLGILAGWKLVETRYGSRAALIGILILLLSRAFIYDCVTVRTPAPAFALGIGCLLCAALLDALLRENNDEANENARARVLVARYAWGASLMAGAAVLTRLSLLPLALLMPLYFSILVWRRPRGIRARALPALWLGAVGLPLGAIAYFAWQAGDRFWFGVYHFHKWLGEGIAGDLKSSIPHFIQNALLTYTLVWNMALAATAGLALFWLWRARQNERALVLRLWSFESLVAASWLAITLVHMTRRPAYPTYQVALGWAPLILGAYAAHRLLQIRPHWGKPLALGIAAISVAGWALQEGSLHFAPAERLRTPAGVRDLAAPLRAAPGKKLAAFEAGLAFCAPQTILLPGYEMSEFSLVPRLPAARQEYFRGVSARKLQEDLKERADFFAVRPRDIGWLLEHDRSASPDAINESVALYEQAAIATGYGQLGEPMALWRRKNERAVSPKS